MGPPQRQRFNAKARQSSVGGSSHKRRGKPAKPPRDDASHGDAATSHGTPAGLLPDCNREMIVPGSVQEEMWSAKDKFKKELLAASTTADPSRKLSAKKRKRLDAYIASRLKKEARTDLLQELAVSSAQVSHERMDFASARTLGTGKLITAREMIEGKVQNGIATGPRNAATLSDSGEEGEDGIHRNQAPPATFDDPQGEMLEDPQRRQRISEAASLFAPSPRRSPPIVSPEPVTEVSSVIVPSSTSTSLGSALAKGSDGQPLIPVCRKRKRKGLFQSQRRVPRVDRLEGGSGVEVDSESNGDKSESEGSEDSDSREENKNYESSSHTQQTADYLRRPRASTIYTDSDKETTFDEDEADTSSEDEVVLMEAMRCRGLPLPKEDDQLSAGEGDHLSNTANVTSRQISTHEFSTVSPSVDRLATPSPPWCGFASEEDAPNLRSSAKQTESSTEASSSGEAREGCARDVDGNFSPHRHEFTRDSRSSGFKDWARTALDSISSCNVVPTSRTEEGMLLQPVAGLSTKVSEMGPKDGIIRGPLGGKEHAFKLSLFATKYYNEVGHSKAIRNVPVQRTADIIESRLKLPIVQEEDRIVRTIIENPVTVICGETGSGKTTQVAQMLFERGFGTSGSDNPGLVGITQPRRVAAMSTADRVAKELNLPPNRVSYQIRYDGTVSPQTSLKFMTDGVLLRELANDLLLSRYSVVVIDEAHERSVNTDVLVGMLSRVVRLRATRWLQDEKGAKPLRLIIMSATLRVADFVENATLFPVPPPLIRIDTRQHPVSVHFNRKTPNNYQEEAVNKACKIHTRLPPGGILIFLTGEQEIKAVCNQLEGRFGRQAVEAQSQSQRHSRLQPIPQRKTQERNFDKVDDVRLTCRPTREGVEAEDVTLGVVDERFENPDRIENGRSSSTNKDPEALDTDSEEEEGIDEDLGKEASLDHEIGETAATPMHILPLYSLLPSEKQLEVFKAPPENTRLVIVATNVAETSLTIPNIRYVIDCGRAKERKYDGQSGISSFKVGWISKASAAQRAGRAGRTGPGHCYRLYSSNVYEEYLDDFAQAEISRMPVEGLVLQMKSMNIDNVINFPFPTPPDRKAIATAERMLTRLGALESVMDEKSRKHVARITELGRAMSFFPLSPRFAKLLVQGQQHGCLPFVVALVAAMSVGDVFVRNEFITEDEGFAQDTQNHLNDFPNAGHLSSEAERRKHERREKQKKRYETIHKFDSLGGIGISDAFRILAVVGSFAYSGGSTSFCKDNFLRIKAMEEIEQLRTQLSTLVLSTLEPSTERMHLACTLSTSKLEPPSEKQFKVIRQLIACAYIDQVAVRADVVPAAARFIPSLAEQASQGQLKTQWKTCRHVPYLAMGVHGEAAFIHPSSSLYEHAPPEWCVFGEVLRSRPKVQKGGEYEGQTKDSLEEAEAPGRVLLKDLTRINPAWIPKLGKDMCTFSNVTPLTGESRMGSLVDSIALLKSGSTKGASSQQPQEIVVTPVYGTGPACEPSERASMIGWELPPIKAKRKWLGGLTGWKVEL